MKTVDELREQASAGAELIRSGVGNQRCKVCGGRVIACFHFGHIPEKDRKKNEHSL